MKSCDFHQFVLTSALDKTGSLPWFTRRHLSRCNACQTLWTNLNQMHDQFLQKGEEIRCGAIKDPLVLPLPDFDRLQHCKIPARAIRVFRPIFGLAAVMMLLVVVGIWTIKPVKPVAKPEVLRSLPEGKSPLAAIGETLAATVRDDPLEQELQGLIGSAKSAAEFLQTKIKKAAALSKDGG